MIAHWPAGISAEKGSITDQPAHLIDFMATCIDVGEGEYPESWPEVDLEPLQGKSLKPIFKGEKREPHDFLYFHFSDNRAIRKGKWKVVTHKASQWELYDIEKDGTEMNNLADQHPEKVEELSKLWHESAEKVDHLKGKAIKPVSGKAPPKLAKDGRPIK